MARKPREKSSTGIYHVMFRGINGQVVFKDHEDCKKLLQTIKKYKKVSQYTIYAYCLMNNHVHLLIKEEKEDLGIIFRRIGASYVYWYNRKYKRRGPLFQDRYKSEPVEDDKYFLTVLRYIHQNPIKAGIEKDIKKYSWSSYNEYIRKVNICDINFPLSLFAENKKRAVKLFKNFNEKKNDDRCLEYEEQGRIDDTEGTQIIIEIAEVEDPGRVQDFQRDKRDKIIKELKSRGLSIRQIERLTGVSFGIIRRI